MKWNESFFAGRLLPHGVVGNSPNVLENQGNPELKNKQITLLASQAVFFPTVIVCNVNQIKKSFFRSLKTIHPDLEIELLYRYFYTGMERNLTEEEQGILTKIATSEVSGQFPPNFPFDSFLWIDREDLV